MSDRFVLSIEDNDADFYLIEMAFQECPTEHQLMRVVDGEKALEYLKKIGHSIDTPLPQLILLDQNMPNKDGFDVLTFMQQQGLTERIPVVMFTSNGNIKERDKALSLGATEFITKPFELEQVTAELNRVCAKYLKPSVSH